MSDLFGVVPKPNTGFTGIKKRKDPQPRGYAARPGSGPKGETCKTCRHLFRNRLAKTYLKCLMARAKWTGGRASDVLARAPACRMWEALSSPVSDQREAE